ncbi:MAG: hypothetical protein HC875_36540 [Anaerolineales bacterium]|nr:hypothetical protein [Anaerolineales bacterium]
MIIQISTFLGEPWGYLELAGLLCLLALGSGWLGYLYGCHQAPLWRRPWPTCRWGWPCSTAAAALSSK